MTCIYQLAEPAYWAGPFLFGPKIFSRQCFDSNSSAKDEVQNSMANALCDTYKEKKSTYQSIQ